MSARDDLFLAMRTDVDESDRLIAAVLIDSAVKEEL